MTAPSGTVGPNRDTIEQRIRELTTRIALLESRGISQTGVITSDVLGGMATPWLPVHLVPLFAPPAGVFTAMTASVNVAEQTLWTGRIGYLTHPAIQIAGIWGSASGTNSTTYRLKLNGVTAGTWTVSTAAAADGAGGSLKARGPFSALVSGVALRDKDIAVDLTAQSVSGSGTYACQVLGCHLRQST